MAISKRIFRIKSEHSGNYRGTCFFPSGPNGRKSESFCFEHLDFCHLRLFTISDFVLRISPERGSHQGLLRHPGPAHTAARLACTRISPHPLRLPIPQNPTHSGKIRHRRPRRLPAFKQIQMVCHQVPKHLLRRPALKTRQKQQTSIHQDAQRSNQASKGPHQRPHQP